MSYVRYSGMVAKVLWLVCWITHLSGGKINPKSVYFDTVMLGRFITNKKLVTLNIRDHNFVIALFSFVLDLQPSITTKYNILFRGKTQCLTTSFIFKSPAAPGRRVCVYRLLHRRRGSPVCREISCSAQLFLLAASHISGGLQICIENHNRQ